MKKRVSALLVLLLALMTALAACSPDDPYILKIKKSSVTRPD